jgi:hypothetical protein
VDAQVVVCSPKSGSTVMDDRINRESGKKPVSKPKRRGKKKRDEDGDDGALAG